MKTSPQVPVGLASKLGLVSSAALAVLSIVQAVEANAYLLTGPSKVSGIASFSLIIVTILGRMYQARGLPASGAVNAVAQLPDALAALAAEAQANVAKVAASPDVGDGPHVAFAQSPDDAAAPAPAA